MIGESGYERVKNDAYYTPAWCTEALLRNVEFIGTVWEPAAGNGQMVDVLEAAGLKVYASDIAPTSHGIVALDFLSTSPFPLDSNRPAGVRHIVTNPPYQNAQIFIERALAVALYVEGKVAMLLRNEYDSASTRQHLFGDCPQFAMKLVLTKRPRWFEDSKVSPRHNHSWFLWDWAHEGPPIIKYDQ